MSAEDCFFDNAWDAGENLVDAAVYQAKAIGHAGAALYHSAVATQNALFGNDAEDRREMNEHYDASLSESAAMVDSLENAWDEIL